MNSKIQISIVLLLLVAIIMTGVYFWKNTGKKQTNDVNKYENSSVDEDENNSVDEDVNSSVDVNKTKNIQLVDSAPDVSNNKKMCFYTNVYEMCNTKCGDGKRFRKQIEYTQDMNINSYGIDPDDLTLHECQFANNREFIKCTGTNCSDEFTYNTFKEQNPDIPSSDMMTKYCEFIDENDACTDPNVMTTGACRETCSAKWR